MEGGNTTPLPVKMGNGFQANAQGECRDLIIEVGKVKLTITALLFDLDDIDLVLGMAWLTKLGEMWVDWMQQLMRFKFNGDWVELSGAGSQLEQQGDLPIFLAKSRHEVDVLYMSIEGQGVTTAELSPAQKHEVDQMLCRFAVIFQEPRGMPPMTKQEHNLFSGRAGTG